MITTYNSTFLTEQNEQEDALILQPPSYLSSVDFVTIFFLLFLFCIGVELINNIMIVSG